MRKNTGSIEKKLGLHSRAQSLHFPQPGRSLTTAENEHQGRENYPLRLLSLNRTFSTLVTHPLKIRQSNKNLLDQIPDSERQTQRKWKNRTRHTDATVMFPPQPTHKHGYTQQNSVAPL